MFQQIIKADILLVFFLASSELEKIPRNSQNIHAYHMPNHWMGCMYLTDILGINLVLAGICFTFREFKDSELDRCIRDTLTKTLTHKKYRNNCTERMQKSFISSFMI